MYMLTDMPKRHCLFVLAYHLVGNHRVGLAGDECCHDNVQKDLEVVSTSERFPQMSTLYPYQSKDE
jgi:hypothetical protein